MVNIEEKGFIGQPVELTARGRGTTPFTIDTDTGDLLTPVRGSGCDPIQGLWDRTLPGPLHK